MQIRAALTMTKTVTLFWLSYRCWHPTFVKRTRSTATYEWRGNKEHHQIVPSKDTQPGLLPHWSVEENVPYLVAIVNDSCKQRLSPITLRTAIEKTASQIWHSRQRPFKELQTCVKYSIRQQSLKESCSSSFAWPSHFEWAAWRIPFGI